MTQLEFDFEEERWEAGKEYKIGDLVRIAAKLEQKPVEPEEELFWDYL